MLDILEQNGFSQLEFQQMRCDATLPQRGRHGFDQVAAAKLQGGKIHRHAQLG